MSEAAAALPPAAAAVSPPAAGPSIKPAGPKPRADAVPPATEPATRPQPRPPTRAKTPIPEASAYGRTAATTMQLHRLRLHRRLPKHRTPATQQPHRPRRCCQGRRRAVPPRCCSPTIAATPRGERAPDGLFYLGQALMQLGQPGQACKAYAELKSVYKTGIRRTSRSCCPRPKSQAHCN